MKKRIGTIGAVVGIFFACAFIAYAISTLFFQTTEQSSNYGHKDYWSFEMADVFTETGEIGPGESKSINPVVVSKSTDPAYTVIYVTMPLYNGAGLYEINSGWTLVDSGESNGKWFEAYLYNQTLEPGASTSQMASIITMKNIGIGDYVQYGEDLNVTMTGYAIGADDTEIGRAHV